IHRVLRPERTEEFEQFFLRGETLYSNLYPARFESKGTEWIEQGPVYPTPKTAQSCKRHKGFLPIKGEDSDGHGVRDSLADWALFKLGESYPSINRLAALRTNKICKSKDVKCNEPLDHFEEYYRCSTINSERLIRTKNESRLQTH